MALPQTFSFHELEKAKAEILYERQTQLSGIQDPDWYEHPTLLEIWERAKENRLNPTL